MANNSPFFSVIVPVYNVEKYLDFCVQSIVSQTEQDFELILVDDGSPDNSPKMCDEYAEKYKNVKVIHKKNGGASDSRNFGLEVAVGQYILFCDSDDFFCDNNCFSILKSKLQNSNTDVLIFGYKKYFTIDKYYCDRPVVPINNKNASNEEKIKHLMHNNSIIASTWDKALSRRFIEDNKLRLVVGQVGEDIEWCLNILKFKPNIDMTEECFYAYRQQNGASVSSNIKRKNIVDVFSIIKRFYVDKNDMATNNFLAVQYVQLLLLFHYTDKSKIKDIIKEAKNYMFLLSYDWYPNVKKIAKFKFLGYEMLLLMLKMFKKIRK